MDFLHSKIISRVTRNAKGIHSNSSFVSFRLSKLVCMPSCRKLAVATTSGLDMIAPKKQQNMWVTETVYLSNCHKLAVATTFRLDMLKPKERLRMWVADAVYNVDSTCQTATKWRWQPIAGWICSHPKNN